jgi:hypothetical protein
MTAPREDVASASEQAEIYLRLRSETELRAALGFPRVKPQRHRDHRAGILGRWVHGRIMRQHRSAARWTGSTPPSGSGVTRIAASAAGALNQVSTFIAFRFFRFQRQWMRRRHGRTYEPAPAESCIGRVEAIAAALTGAGALNDVTAMAVVSDLRVALAARSLVDHSGMLDEPSLLAAGWSTPASATPGPVTCFPIGITADSEIEGKPARFYLSSLLLSPAKGTLEFSATIPPEVLAHGPRIPRPMRALDDVTASDDRGGNYRAHFSGGGGADRWDGRFHLMPVPPVGIRWLDVTLPGGKVVRVPLDAPAAPLTATFTPLPAAERADRFLDAVTCGLLLNGTARGDDEDSPESVLTATALLEAGVVKLESAGLGRFAAAAALAGVHLPPPLAGIPPQDLPVEWLSLMARRDKEDGPTGVVPFAASLPELDGARCILTGLRSEPERATLQMHAQGWPDHDHRRSMAEVFRWTARDDVGGWYLTTLGGGSWGGGEADLELWLQPTLNPQARALEVILTGPTGQVSVAVPLKWQEGL